MRIASFRALRPRPDHADRVVCAPYDILEPGEVRTLAENSPLSFLQVTRPEVNFPPEQDPYADEVYVEAARRLHGLVEDGVLLRDKTPSLYVYRLEKGHHVQTGVAACCRVDDYAEGRIKRHEGTLAVKEEDRTRLIKTLRAHTGPVFLTYRDVPAIHRIVNTIVAGQPVVQIQATGGVRHTVWRAAERSGALADAFDELVPACYIADGHHRAAAALRAARDGPDNGTSAPWDRFVGVLFPASQVRILPYHRCLRDLNGRDADSFLSQIDSRFLVQKLSGPPLLERGRIGLFAAGQWRELSWADGPADDPVLALDVSVLQERLFRPVLGLAGRAADAHVDYVTGLHGVGELEARVRDGRAVCAFAMHPVSVEDVMAVADAGGKMPPKSTWFEPKLASGLLVHTVD